MKAPDDTHTPDFIGGSAPAGTVNRYQGGKNGAGVYQTIINHIPWHWRYVEAFAGSAAIFRNLRPARGGAILIERDPQQADKLRRDLASPNVTILQDDALVALQTLKLGAQDFVYVDPPYHPDARRDRDLYRYELDADHHETLLHDILPDLSDRGATWALSGYQCPAYERAAHAYGWHRTDYQAMTRRGVVIESLWTPFDPTMVDLHDHRFLGADFRERERIQRKVKRIVAKLGKLHRHERGAIMAALSNIATSGDARSSIARSGERIPHGE